MTRLAKNHPTLFSFVLLLVAIPLALRYAPLAAMAPTPVSSEDLATTLIRAGLDPEALAAAGLDGQEAAGVVDDFETAMGLEAGRLASADAEYAQARVSSDSLRRLIQSGQGEETDVSDYQTAMSDLAAAETEREATLDEWFEAATASLASAETATLETIRGNRHWGLDIEMLAVDRAEAEWVTLRDALSHERVAGKYGEPVSQSVASYLATCRSVTEVANAKTACSANLASVQSAWNTAIE